MPELPEVETVANGVDARVRGARIRSVWTSGKPQTFKSPEAEIADTLTGATILRVRRVGKTIVMSLRTTPTPAAADADTAAGANRDHAADAEFLIHLGMTGRLLVSAPEVALPPHTHAVLSLADGRELRFVDPRRFGRLSVHQLAQSAGTPALRPLTRSAKTSPRASSKEPPSTTTRAASEDPRPSAPSRGRANTATAVLNNITSTNGYVSPGREPLTISPADFAALFRRRKTPIKAALLNQSILTGVGNIYADEALARAGIRPRRQAARLTRAEHLRLHAALTEVLARAIELGGSSVSDYVDADGIRGFFQLEHRVYGRTGLPCATCATPIKRIVIGGRSTHFCPVCQT